MTLIEKGNKKKGNEIKYCLFLIKEKSFLVRELACSQAVKNNEIHGIAREHTAIDRGSQLFRCLYIFIHVGSTRSTEGLVLCDAACPWDEDRVAV